MALKKTAALIAVAGAPADDKTIKDAFLAAYGELESRPVSYTEAVEAAFASLPTGFSVDIFKEAALKIARRVDNGEDNTGENPYHNRHHFAKVVVNYRALAEINNARSAETGVSLKSYDIARGLFAAVAHDICHDGKTNTVKDADGKDKHIPFRLEQISVNKAREWAKTGDQYQDSMLADALSLIYATDLSTPPGGHSPGSIVRARYDHVVKGVPLPDFAAQRERRLDSFSKFPSDDQTPIPKRSLTIAGLLQDADVFASVFDNDQSLKESTAVSMEARGRATDSTRELGFLRGALNERMTTDVARRLCDPWIREAIGKYSKMPPGTILQP